MAVWMSHTGIDLLSNIHNFLLVESDHRTEYRHRAYFIVAARLCTVWLATWPMLSPVISPRHPCSFHDAFRDLHHIPAHNDRQLIVWALIIDIQLNIRKVNHIQIDRSCILPPVLPDPQLSVLHARWYMAVRGNKQRQSLRHVLRSYIRPLGVNTAG